MSKKRRTRKEKMIAATRHDFSNFFTLSSDIREIIPPIQKKELSQIRQAPNNYSYVITDIQKTLLIVSLLVLFNFVFFFALKFKLINLFEIAF